MRIRARVDRELTEISVRTDELPPGVCGRVQGVALVYGVVDSYGTMFKAGCLDRTRAEKLAAGKIKLLADHERETGAHIGVVRSLTDVGDRVVMSADLFDTAAGRAQLEYLRAVMAAGASTGLSIGFYERGSDIETQDGHPVLCYSEVELEEISNTPAPAVPGADVVAARREPAELQSRALEALLRVVPEEEAVDAYIRVFGDCLFRSFAHNSTLAAAEPSWGSVDKTKLPRAAFARKGDAAKPSTWGYPHHWVKGGGDPSDDGRYTTGTMYLHKGGLNAAWAAAQGAHTGEKAEASVISHLEAHRRALGLDDKKSAPAAGLGARGTGNADTHAHRDAPADTGTATNADSRIATMDERRAAVRHSFARD